MRVCQKETNKKVLVFYILLVFLCKTNCEKTGECNIVNNSGRKRNYEDRGCQNTSFITAIVWYKVLLVNSVM